LEEVEVVQVDQAKTTEKAEASKQAKKEEEEAAAPVGDKETAEEQENTHKWAAAVLETKPKKSETKSDEGKTPEMSKDEYDKLFHQAAEQANDEWANKTFEDFQKEDQ
jgi:hypothetical protein